MIEGCDDPGYHERDKEMRAMWQDERKERRFWMEEHQ